MTSAIGASTGGRAILHRELNSVIVTIEGGRHGASERSPGGQEGGRNSRSGRRLDSAAADGIYLDWDMGIVRPSGPPVIDWHPPQL